MGLIHGTRVPRVRMPTPAPLEVIDGWEEFGRLNPPVSAIAVDAIQEEVGRILTTGG